MSSSSHTWPLLLSSRPQSCGSLQGARECRNLDAQDGLCESHSLRCTSTQHSMGWHCCVTATTASLRATTQSHTRRGAALRHHTHSQEEPRACAHPLQRTPASSSGADGKKGVRSDDPPLREGGGRRAAGAWQEEDSRGTCVIAAHVRAARMLVCGAAVADSEHLCPPDFSVCRHV